MIDRHAKLSISRQADLLKLSRGSVYYLPRPVSERDLDVIPKGHKCGDWMNCI